MGRARFARRGRESRLIPAASTVRRDCFLSSPGSLSRLRRFGAWALPGTGVSRLSPDFPFRLVRRGMVLCLVLLLAGLWMGDARAQGAAVCNNTPVDGLSIYCLADEFYDPLNPVTADPNKDIVLYVDGLVIRPTLAHVPAIWVIRDGGTTADPKGVIIRVTRTETTTNSAVAGVQVTHEGDGYVDIDVTDSEMSGGGITVEYLRTVESGVVTRTPTGDIDITVKGTTISTTDALFRGVDAKHEGTGDIGITVKGTTISTTGQNAEGVYTDHSGSGDIGITVEHSELTAKGDIDAGGGITAVHTGSTGDIDIRVKHTEIVTGFDTTDSVTGHNDGIHVQRKSTGSGDINIALEHTGITTKYMGARGIYAQHEGAGHIILDLNPGVTIDTTGPGVYIVQQGTTTESDVILNARGIAVTTGEESAHGLWADRQGGLGDVIMDIRDSAITTENNQAWGIYATSQRGADGDVGVRITNGRTTTNGSNAHGIFAYHGSANDPPRQRRRRHQDCPPKSPHRDKKHSPSFELGGHLLLRHIRPTREFRRRRHRHAGRLHNDSGGPFPRHRCL